MIMGILYKVIVNDPRRTGDIILVDIDFTAPDRLQVEEGCGYIQPNMEKEYRIWVTSQYEKRRRHTIY